MLKASINLIKDLKKQKRENSSLLFLDNIKIIKDCISQGIVPQLILVAKEEYNLWGDKFNVMLTDSKTIEQLSDSRTPQGVVCIVEYTQDIVKKPKNNFLVVDGLQDPGNVGTLIRTATACGFNDIYLIDSVKVSNSKLVRSSVGTIFSSNIYSLSQQEFISLAKEWDLFMVKADMDGENVFKAAFPSNIGVVVGNEGQGVSDAISAICKKSISIPMKSGVESLNASISGAIIMYQIAKDKF